MEGKGEGRGWTIGGMKVGREVVQGRNKKRRERTSDRGGGKVGKGKEE